MDTKEEKEEKVCIPFDDVPVFYEVDYFGWRARMKAYLKKYGVWEIVINVAAPSNKKSKVANQKEAKKNNTTTLNIFVGWSLSQLERALENLHWPEKFG